MAISKLEFKLLIDLVPSPFFGMRRVSILGSLKIFLASLTNLNALDVLLLDSASLVSFGSVLSDIWIPNAKKKSELNKKDWLASNFENIVSWFIEKKETISYETIENDINQNNTNLDQLISDLDGRFEEKKVSMANDWYETANPFITAFISNSWEEGKKFQINAKTSSSVETLWGSWIERVLEVLNPDLFYINAGGFDFIYEGVAYDVKSGPQVMNKDQVAEANLKQKAIQSASNNPILTNIFGLTDFKVAIAYGNRQNAWPFMAQAVNIIIYGSETWQILTKNEYNAFIVFLKCITLKQEKFFSWCKNDLFLACNNFNNVFYLGDKDKLNILLNLPEYLSIYSTLND